MSKFNVGDKVIAISKQAHKDDPESYPKVGTIGYVQEAEGGSKLYKVQWQLGSTSCNNLWCAREDEIELFNRYMTNEEIWKMLENKMQKNGLTSKVSVIKTNIDNYPNNEVEIIKAYYESDVINAIAIAYRSGYERAMKGRPFKIGEKKKGEHWEPVDPNNLPKEGTKVRYSRHVDDIGGKPFSDWSKIQIGEETVSMYMGNKFGVKDIHDIYRNSHFIYSAHHPERFDMWVEDDE